MGVVSVKMVFSGRVKRLIGIVIGICLLIVALFNVIGYFFDCKYISVAAAVAQVDKYEVRSRLLMDAMDQVGVGTPEDAAVVWANGLETRSAALQYSVMGTELKKEYAKQLDKNYPNWVTGVSSPWISAYKITNIETIGVNQYAVRLTLSTATSSGPYADYNAVLIVVLEGDFWRITNISADPGLSAYMGFNP